MVGCGCLQDFVPGQMRIKSPTEKITSAKSFGRQTNSLRYFIPKLHLDIMSPAH